MAMASLTQMRKLLLKPSVSSAASKECNVKVVVVLLSDARAVFSA